MIHTTRSQLPHRRNVQVLELGDVLGHSAFPLATGVHFKILQKELGGLLPTTWSNSNKQPATRHRRLETTKVSAVSQSSKLRSDLLNGYDPLTAPFVYRADGTIAPVNVSVGLRFYAIRKVHEGAVGAEEEAVLRFAFARSLMLFFFPFYCWLAAKESASIDSPIACAIMNQ